MALKTPKQLDPASAKTARQKIVAGLETTGYHSSLPLIHREVPGTGHYAVLAYGH
jgi:hypothetical protein